MYSTPLLGPEGHQTMKRSDITQALDQLPDRALLGAGSKELTPRQRKFARELAKGATGAEAYRRSYNVKTQNKKSHGDTASLIKAHPGVQREIEAHKAALEAMEYRTPASLRALIVQTLTQTLIDPDVSPAVRIQAARVLGTVTEVSAFTHRTEQTIIKRSDDARQQLLTQLQDMMRTVDANGQSDAEALLAELAAAEPHPAPTSPDASVTHHGSIHTIPHNQSPIFSETPPLLEPEPWEDPPSVLDKK